MHSVSNNGDALMQTQSTTRRPGKYEAALRLLPEGAQIADQVWAGSNTETDTAARKAALHHGSAAKALEAFGHVTNQLGDAGYRQALSRLISLEDGSAVARCDEFIAIAKGDALTAWLARKEIVERKAAEWRRDLTVAKAAMFSTAVAA